MAKKKASKKAAKKSAKKPAKKKPAKKTVKRAKKTASRAAKTMMPTCGVSHNHCGGLCDRRQGHPDPEHHCSQCGAWF